MHRASLPLMSADVIDTDVTPRHPVDGRRRRVRGAVVLGIVVSVLAVFGVSCTRNAHAFQLAQLTNSERNARGIGSLAIDDTLVNKAQAWAEHMAAVGAISHSRLTDGAGSNWQILGENVGVAPSIPRANELLMNSPPHRQNILNGSFNRIGTGVAQSGGQFYVVQVFAG